MFAAPDDPEAARWAAFIGHWRSASTDLVLLIRRRTAGEPHPTLFGTIPRGPHEGVLSLTVQDHQHWRGVHLDLGTRQRAALLTRQDDGTLTLEIAAGRTLRFVRVADADLALPHRISIICHRGLNLGRVELSNSIAGIRHSRQFGCSGIELDVTVPHDARRQPVLDALRIYHPPEWRSEVTGFDTVPVAALSAAPTIGGALRAAQDAGLEFVYLDPKLQWLVVSTPDRAHEAIQRIVAAAAAGLSGDPWATIAIGAAGSRDLEAAGMLSTLRKEKTWPAGLTWALEMTRGTDDRRALDHLTAADLAARPDIASINLLRVDGGGGGLLRLLVPSLPDGAEPSLSRGAQAVIYWTAHGERQFEGALQALDRIRPGAANAGVMTPYPHRLAFHLATRTRRP